MNLKNYRNAVRYVESKEYTDGRDLVHDSYLYWNKKTGRDLFDEPMPLIVTILKHHIGTRHTANTFMWRGETHMKSWYSFQIAPEDKNMDYNESKYNHYHTPDYESNLDSEKFIKEIEEKLTKFQLEIFKKGMDGYSQVDIANDLNASPQVINYHKKQISNLGKQVINGQQHGNTSTYVGTKTESRRRLQSVDGC